MASSGSRRHHRPEERTLHEEAAHPEQTVDQLEEQVLGQVHDQERENTDESDAGTEPS